MYVIIYIIYTRTHPPRLAVARNGWKLRVFVDFFNLSPCVVFQKTCPAGLHAGNFFIISLEPLKACSFEGVPVGDTLTNPAAQSFLYSRMESKICWRPGFRCNAAAARTWTFFSFFACNRLFGAAKSVLGFLITSRCFEEPLAFLRNWLFAIGKRSHVVRNWHTLKTKSPGILIVPELGAQ